MKIIDITAYSLPDAWFQSLYALIDHGREFVIDSGSFAGQKRLELDYVTIHIKNPETMPMVPHLNPLLGIPDPVSEDYLDNYLPYLMTASQQPGEEYTYGQRLCCPGADQVQKVIDDYKNKGHRTNQMVLQIAGRGDLWLQEPPCLRHIDSRIQDNKLHFFPYFRSNDLYSGFPANLAAIELLKQYMAAEIGVGNGDIVYSSKGLHLYDYCVELVEAIRGRRPIKKL